MEESKTPPAQNLMVSNQTEDREHFKEGESMLSPVDTTEVDQLLLNQNDSLLLKPQIETESVLLETE